MQEFIWNPILLGTVQLILIGLLFARMKPSDGSAKDIEKG